MNTCGTCKFFGQQVTGLDKNIPTGYHKCTWIQQFDEYGEKPTAPALVVDGSGYYAALCIKEDFGCNQWQAGTAGDSNDR